MTKGSSALNLPTTDRGSIIWHNNVAHTINKGNPNSKTGQKNQGKFILLFSLGIGV